MKFYGISLKNQLNIQSLMSFYHFYFDENYQSNGENHNFWELVYVKRGLIGVTADTRFYELSEGMIIFHKPNEFHKLWSVGGTKPEIYVCSFYCDDGYLNKLEQKIFCLNDFEKSIIEEISNILTEISECCINTQKEEHIFRLKNSENSNKLQIVKAALEFLLCKISQKVSVDKNALTSNVFFTHEDIFRNAVGFLNENISSSVMIEDICKKINVSNSTLKRIFKKYSGISVKKYFLNLKIQKSKELLKQDMQIKDISETLGFSSQNYFCYTFKRETGQTPFSYKQKSR